MIKIKSSLAVFVILFFSSHLFSMDFIDSTHTVRKYVINQSDAEHKKKILKEQEYINFLMSVGSKEVDVAQKQLDWFCIDKAIKWNKQEIKKIKLENKKLFAQLSCDTQRKYLFNEHDIAAIYELTGKTFQRAMLNKNNT